MYGGVNAAVRSIISKLGIEVTWLVESSVESFKNAVKDNTKVRSLIRQWVGVRGG